MIIRVTGLLIKDDELLLIEQDTQERSWSLPGGTLEEGESLETALIREMKEETGLDVAVQELLYICDFITPEKHVVHITFAIGLQGGSFSERDTGIDTNAIKSVKFVEISQLTRYGFSDKFQELVLNGFPGKGSYMGNKSNIGL